MSYNYLIDIKGIVEAPRIIKIRKIIKEFRQKDEQGYLDSDDTDYEEG